MAVSTNATAFDAPSAPALSLSNRFQPLEELSHNEEATDSYSKFQAQGVYKPPHMRIPSESVASITGPDPTANSTSGVRTVHGPSSDHKKKGASRPNTPHIGSTSGSAVFGFDEIKKKIHEEVLMVRKAAKEMETIEKDFLEEGARFEQDLKVLKSAGLTDQEIRKLIGWNPTNLPSKPLSLEPLDVNVSICFNIAMSGRRTYLGCYRTLGRTWHALASAPSRKLNNPRRHTRKNRYNRPKRIW